MLRTIAYFAVVVGVAWGLLLLGFYPGPIGKLVQKILMHGETGKGPVLTIIADLPAFPGLLIVAFREVRKPLRRFVPLLAGALIVATCSSFAMLYATRHWPWSEEFPWWGSLWSIFVFAFVATASTAMGIVAGIAQERALKEQSGSGL